MLYLQCLEYYQHGYNLVVWLWSRMSFLKRKRVKFSVDLQVCNLSDVPLVNAVLFAKIRLLEGGTFDDHTERVEVVRNSAAWSHRSSFSCRIPSDPSSGTLERCLCRISIRKVTFIFFIPVHSHHIIHSGISRSYLLDGYGLNQRQDNSKVQVKVTMCHQSADPFFRVPRIGGVGAAEDRSLNPLDRKAPAAGSDEETDDVIGLVSFRNIAAEVLGETYILHVPLSFFVAEFL
uniref:C2 NT-type domain-containing protein n=1 Tax=Heterorhabditis bacteriophora TaxID=37862 RepID=A0A1I7X634_HETBA